jgi:uncharacterized protein (DUF433 family)
MALEVLMNAQPDTFTPAEAAVIAGVSVRDVHRMIDEHILPDRLFDSQESRSFKSQACVFISFYFGAADRLTAEERQRTIVLASKVADWSKTKTTVQDEFLTIDFASFSKGVEERLERLRAARDLVVADPEILSGTPVIRGTRVPVYDVAASVAAGISMERILSSYPSLKREQVELAALFAEANPQRGRPRQRELPANAVVVSKHRKMLTQPA